jgi:1,4-dihydroxy-6-naphthoate synthase
VARLTFGFTPCPNDAFAFHALVHGLVDAPFDVKPVLLDIEELNRRARSGDLDLTKLSFGAAPGAGDRYRLLRSGAALGHGAGPLVVAREEMDLEEAAVGRIAIPGQDTTAFLLLRLAAPRLGDVQEVRYDRILGAVAEGAVDAGLIIHESRFTYRDHGLVSVADLGEWWEQETGLPVPLAGIYARADLPEVTIVAAEAALRESVEYAFAHPEASREYVRAHSHELSEEVCRAHIQLYVNEFSIDLGDEGLAAIERLSKAGTTLDV